MISNVNRHVSCFVEIQNSLPWNSYRSHPFWAGDKENGQQCKNGVAVEVAFLRHIRFLDLEKPKASSKIVLRLAFVYWRYP